MYDTLLHLFNQRTTGEQTLILIAAAIFFLVGGIKVGKAASHLFGG
jgi:hypothetical protein